METLCVADLAVVVGLPTRWENYLNGNLVRRGLGCRSWPSHSLGKLLEWKQKSSDDGLLGQPLPTRWENYLNKQNKSPGITGGHHY